MGSTPTRSTLRNGAGDIPVARRPWIWQSRLEPSNSPFSTTTPPTRTATSMRLLKAAANESAVSSASWSFSRRAKAWSWEFENAIQRLIMTLAKAWVSPPADPGESSAGVERFLFHHAAASLLDHVLAD